MHIKLASGFFFNTMAVDSDPLSSIYKHAKYYKSHLLMPYTRSLLKLIIYEVPFSQQNLNTWNLRQKLYGWTTFMILFASFFSLKVSHCPLWSTSGKIKFLPFTFCGRNKVMVWINMRVSKGFLGELSIEDHTYKMSQ